MCSTLAIIFINNINISTSEYGYYISMSWWYVNVLYKLQNCSNVKQDNKGDD